MVLPQLICHSPLNTLGLEHLAKVCTYNMKTNFLLELSRLRDIPMTCQQGRVSGTSTFASLREYDVFTLNNEVVSPKTRLSIYVMENVLLPIRIYDGDEYKSIEVPVMIHFPCGDALPFFVQNLLQMESICTTVNVYINEDMQDYLAERCIGEWHFVQYDDKCSDSVWKTKDIGKSSLQFPSIYKGYYTRFLQNKPVT